MTSGPNQKPEVKSDFRFGFYTYELLVETFYRIKIGLMVEEIWDHYWVHQFGGPHTV